MKAAKLGAWAIESDPFGVKKAAKLGAFGEDGHIRQVIWAIEFIWAIESDPFGVKKAAKLGAFGEDGHICLAILAGSGRLREICGATKRRLIRIIHRPTLARSVSEAGRRICLAYASG
jgi:hypothetical protein